MRIIKNLRLLAGLAILAGFILAWLRFDTFGGAATSLASWQFIHSIFALTITAAPVGLITVLLITLLVGRVYCSTICPLGLLQDLIARLTRRFNRKPYQPVQPYSKLHSLVFSMVAGSAVAGFIFPLAIIEPFSTFGQIFAGVFQPLAAQIFRSTAPLLSTGINWLGQTSVKPFSLLNTTIAFLLLTGLSIATYKAGRIYCNTICPVGGILRFISRFSLFKLSIISSTCTSCKQCEKVCKAGCINVAQKTLDFSRCVSCYNCVASCNFSAIKFGRSKPTVEQPIHLPGRRAALVTLAGAAAGYLMPKTLVAGSEIPKQILPPGAMTAEHFYQTCISCHLCVTACPSSVILPHAEPSGPKSILKPALNFELGMCEQNCNLCSQICPVNAIQSVPSEKKKFMKIGEVEYKKHLCVVETDGKDCGACAEHCPTQAVSMVPYHNNLMIPKTNPDICIGCGSCEHICPVRPDRAIIVHPVTKQTFITMPEAEALPDSGVPDDFPF